MDVTVTGGTGQPAISLTYDANDAAFLNAQALAATIDATFTSPIYYDPNNTVSGGDGGYLIVQQQFAQNVIDGKGFGAIVDQNNGVASTVLGGASATGQIVLAGDGGLTFDGFGGNITVAAGGGNNFINFGNFGGNDVVYTSIGDDTIKTGSANATVSAGAGNNQIALGSGAVQILSTGSDVIKLGDGTASVTVGAGGSDIIVGSTNYSGSGYNLQFIGGDLSSTVRGGEGSYSIFGGAGGGSFTGGSAGYNSIQGGSGAVTIKGGGAGDTLGGGTGGGKIYAGGGNETLTGGGSNILLAGGTGNDTFLVGQGDETVRGGTGGDLFQFTNGVGGNGVTDVIQHFGANDFIHLAGFNPNAVADAVASFQTNGISGSIKLDDGTRVILVGVTHLTDANFK